MTGDIAFRFLDYVHQQQQRRRRREDAGVWSHDSNLYSSGTEAVGSAIAGESRAVVCDINQEMLRVGRERAERLDLRAGEKRVENERVRERESSPPLTPPSSSSRSDVGGR